MLRQRLMGLRNTNVIGYTFFEPVERQGGILKV